MIKHSINNRSIMAILLDILRVYWPQIIILTLLVIVTSLFFPGGKSLQYSYQVNDITREPVIAPFNFPIMKTEEKLTSDTEEALKSEPYLFHRRQDIVDSQIEELTEFILLIQEIRHAKVRLEESKDLVYRYRYEPQYKDALTDFTADSTTLAVLLESFQTQYAFSIENPHWSSLLLSTNSYDKNLDVNAFKNELIQICKDRWAEGILDISKGDITSYEVMIEQGDAPILASPEDYHDLESAWILVKKATTSVYPDEDDIRRTLGYEIVVDFMKPNLVFDKNTTERRQQSRLDRVPKYQGTILKNERIVDANTRIDDDILLKLNSLALAVQEREGAQKGWKKVSSIIGRIMIVAVIISFFFTFLYLYRAPVFTSWKMVLLISLLFVTIAGLAYIIVIRFNASPYLIPITVAAMALTILFDARIGFMGTTSMAILSGIIIGNNLDFIIVGMFISSVAMYTVRELRTRSQVFKAIIALLAASFFVVVGIGFFKNISWGSMQMDIVYLSMVSILAPIVTYGLIGPLEIAFKITTDLTLLELLDFDHPLLKRLQQEANGTFNHSIVVGNLAEAAAKAVGARSLLCRVGSYYHDIGKITRPEYFVENQFSNTNKHDNLTSVMSAKAIKNHVKEGLRLAKDYNLPEIVSDFIPMHHGTTRVEYFYQKALKETSDPSSIDESVYKYPGPKPNTKETGILMICEAVEAAVRSIKDPDVFKIEEMINKIIQKRINEGQLDECPLTLDELRRIVGTVDGTTGILPVLRGIYHIRIEYPDDVPPKPDPDIPPNIV